jgi:hypothetical protein
VRIGYGVRVNASAWSGQPIGPFEDACDVGRPQLAGSTTYDAGAHLFRLAGGGTGLSETHDQLHFAWTRIAGDFALSVRVEFLGPEHAPRRTARPGEPGATSTLTGVDLEPDLYVGLFVCSGDPQVLERAGFHDLQLER